LGFAGTWFLHCTLCSFSDQLFVPCSDLVLGGMHDTLWTL
jgi:hypothetical protein